MGPSCVNDNTGAEKNVAPQDTDAVVVTLGDSKDTGGGVDPVAPVENSGTTVLKERVECQINVLVIKKIISRFGAVTLQNLMPLVIELMQIVSRIPHMMGAQKKELVIDTLKYIVDETDAGSWERFDSIIKELIPVVIDNVIEIQKGKLVVSKKLITPGCFPCL